jgi:hypothetical protein
MDRRTAGRCSLFDQSDAPDPNQVDEQAGRSSQFRETGCPPGALRADRACDGVAETSAFGCSFHRGIVVNLVRPV